MRKYGESNPVPCNMCQEIVESRDTRQGMCNKCYYRWYYQKNREKSLKAAKEWRENNREKYNVARRKITLRKYHALTPEQKKKKMRDRAKKMSKEEREKRRQRSKDYYHNNKERSKEKYNQWKKDNRERYLLKSKQYEHRRRARMYQAEYNFDVDDWSLIVNTYKSKCAYCENYFDITELTQDHIIPVSKGGAYVIENIAPACMSCNCKKNDKMPSQKFIDKHIKLVSSLKDSHV